MRIFKTEKELDDFVMKTLAEIYESSKEARELLPDELGPLVNFDINDIED